MTTYEHPNAVVTTGYKVEYGKMRRLLRFLDERRVMSFTADADVVATNIPNSINTIIVVGAADATIRARGIGVAPLVDAGGASWGVVGAQDNILAGATLDINNAFGVRVGSFWPTASTASGLLPAVDAFGAALGNFKA